MTTAHPDVLCELLSTFIHTLMGAEVDALCGGPRRAQQFGQPRHPWRNCLLTAALPGAAVARSEQFRGHVFHGLCTALDATTCAA